MRLLLSLRVSKRLAVTSADAHTRVLCRDKTQIKGSENMSRSPLNQMAGMTIGAIAMLAMAVPALGQETSGTDEAFQLTVVVGLNNTGVGNLPTPGSGGFFSFDISWVDSTSHKYYLADRSNKTIDILDLNVFPPTLTQ